MTTWHSFNLDCQPLSPGPTIIRQAAERRLLESRYTALSDVCCDFADGVLRLRGRVSTYHLKQVALALVADIEGVRVVSNQIEVVVPARKTSQ